MTVFLENIPVYCESECVLIVSEYNHNIVLLTAERHNASLQGGDNVSPYRKCRMLVRRGKEISYMKNSGTKPGRLHSCIRVRAVITVLSAVPITFS